MPTSPRIVLADVPLHIRQRGNDRMATFRCPDDFAYYAALLRDASSRVGCAVHAYVFMTNHVHLLSTPADQRAASRMMQLVASRYARHFNRRYGRTGSLWEGRFRSCVVDKDAYYFSCSRYIELNPVAAGMVEHPASYEWSSFRHNALGAPNGLIVPHPLFSALAASDEERCAAYDALFATELHPLSIAAIRRATYRGDVLGGPAFRAGLEAALGRPLSRFEHGGDRRSVAFGLERARRPREWLVSA